MSDTKVYKYNNLINIQPFIFSKLPQQQDSMSIIVVADSASDFIKNLLQYFINSCYEAKILPPSNNPVDIEKQFKNKENTLDELRQYLSIIDISPESIFKNLREDISTINKDFPEWVKNNSIFNILLPNMNIQYTEHFGKTYSHTIWLVDNVQNIPMSLLTNSHYVFLTYSQSINDFLKRKYSNDFKLEDPDVMMVISNTIDKDMKIFTLNKSRFN